MSYYNREGMLEWKNDLENLLKDVEEMCEVDDNRWKIHKVCKYLSILNAIDKNGFKEVENKYNTFVLGNAKIEIKMNTIIVSIDGKAYVKDTMEHVDGDSIQAWFDDFKNGFEWIDGGFSKLVID